jgi:uncharacterized membrane protein
MEFLDSPVFVLAVLCINIIISQWLIKNTFLKPLSVALLVIVVTAVVANLQIIPSASDNYPLYGGIFTYIAPLAIFYLLLEVNLKNLKQAGMPMLILFVVGSIGTAIGALIGVSLIRDAGELGENIGAIAGMFTGTYTGGSINFNAVAIHYKIMENGPLFAGAVAIDNIITALWMVVTIGLPGFLESKRPSRISQPSPDEENQKVKDQEQAEIGTSEIAILLALGAGTIWLSDLIVALLQDVTTIPSILVLTTIALILAQIPWIQKLKGSRLMGMFSIYLFLAVIGAYCELAALANMGQIALPFFLFVTIIVLVHGLVIYGVGAILRWDWVMVSVASQANVGGSSTALALAQSLKRPHLMLPAILVGSLGNGLGTYLGFLVAGIV